MFENGIIRADPLSHKPIDLWKKYLKQGRVVEPAKTLRLDYIIEGKKDPIKHFFRLNTPIHENKVRFVCISDTHEKLGEMLHMIPDGDVLIHAGDFTNYGDLAEVIKFNQEIGSFTLNDILKIHK